MILRSPAEHEKSAFVMPAWIAGIQAHKDAPGDIHVDLDSSPPCWNDEIERRCSQLSETPSAVFSKEDHRGRRYIIRLGDSAVKYGFRVMDSDIYVQEPRDLWARYIEPKFKDRAPRL